MATALFVALATFLFEDDDLSVFFVFENGDVDGCTLDERGTEARIAPFSNHEDFADFQRVTRVSAGEDVKLEDIALRYGKLATLCFDGGFHWKITRRNRDG